jgi:hypothetical protein
MFVFLKDLERNFLKGFSSRILLWLRELERNFLEGFSSRILLWLRELERNFLEGFSSRILLWLRELERNFLEGFSPRTFYTTMHINFFNFSKLFVPYILCLFFKGPGEKLFGRVLFKNILLTAYNFFFNFKRNLRLFSFAYVFDSSLKRKDLERNLFEWICISI